MQGTQTIPSTTQSSRIDFNLPLAEAGETISRIGAAGVRYGVALVIAWIGAMKFTSYEAQGIKGLVENSPFMGWVYGVATVEGFSMALGVVELAIATMIAMWALSRQVAAVGAALAVGMFTTTLSFMVTTPGVYEASLGGFPALTIVPGQFLVKDVVLLAASTWVLGEALRQPAS